MYILFVLISMMQLREFELKLNILGCIRKVASRLIILHF